MAFKADYIVIGVGQKWPTDLLLKSLCDPELPEAEWWRRMSYLQNASWQTKDPALSDALDKIKEKRYGSRFPVQEIASPQNLPAPSAIEQQRELNYFAPTNSLKRLLKGSWFAEVRSKDDYGEEWTDKFIDALMQSEHRDQIALEWGKEGKPLQIKGHIVGLLKDAGVLKGSYDKIAEIISLTQNPRTFSKYMGAGKKQPFADWVKCYVSPQEE